MTNKQLSDLLLREIFRVGRFMKAHEADVAQRNGLTATQFNSMYMLYREGELPIKQILDLMQTTSGNITVVLEHLLRDGWIRKRKNPEDRRSYLISLTPKGEDVMNRIVPEHHEKYCRFIDRLTKEEKLELRRLLEKIDIPDR